MGILKTATGERAKELLTRKDGKVRVFLFGATWCGACQETTIQLGVAAQQFPSVGFYKINVDKDESLADKYIDDAVPLTLITKNGRKVKSVEGYDDADTWIALVEEVVGE
jgi:thiol-disulfide isomerase/thioredoxin